MYDWNHAERWRKNQIGVEIIMGEDIWRGNNYGRQPTE